MLSFLTEVLICRVAEKRKNSATLRKTLNLPFIGFLLHFICLNDKLYIRTSKVAKNALFWRIFVGTTKKRENRACYITITVVTVIYEVSGGTFAAVPVPSPPVAG